MLYQVRILVLHEAGKGGHLQTILRSLLGYLHDAPFLGGPSEHGISGAGDIYDSAAAGA